MRLKSNRLRIPRQQGYTLVLVLLLLGVAVGAALFSYFNSTALTLESDQKTADALASAKAALIGWAVRRGDDSVTDSRPGEFPCPDTNNDGFAEGSCAAGRLGRIPWKTLGISEPKDSAGETLWYALAGPFRKWNDNPNPLNSDTRGNITVYAANGSTLLADGSMNQNPKGAVAVIFAPGPALGTQNRDAATTAACATTSTTIAQNRCAANYLETSVGKNNATTNGPFIAGSRSDSYNDRVIYITTLEFMPIVEQRVAKELKTILQTYFNTNGYFPFAAAYDDTSGNCAKNVTRGRVPSSIGTAPTSPNVACSGPDWTGNLPYWFQNNKWWRVIYYSVAPGYGKVDASGHDSGHDSGSGSIPGCTGGCLTIDSNAFVPALFFTPGTPLDATWRVPGGTQDNNLAHYLEDAQNKDGWGAGANDIYVTPTAKTFDRDRIYTLAGGAAPQQCANNAAALLALAPCGQPPKLNPQCSTLVTNLVNAVCSCAAAATQMITTPCENTLNPPQCQSAVAALKSCTSGASGHDSGHDSGKGKK